MAQHPRLETSAPRNVVRANCLCLFMGRHEWSRGVAETLKVAGREDSKVFFQVSLDRPKQMQPGSFAVHGVRLPGVDLQVVECTSLLSRG